MARRGNRKPQSSNNKKTEKRASTEGKSDEVAEVVVSVDAAAEALSNTCPREADRPDDVNVVAKVSQRPVHAQHREQGGAEGGAAEVATRLRHWEPPSPWVAHNCLEWSDSTWDILRRHFREYWAWFYIVHAAQQGWGPCDIQQYWAVVWERDFDAWRTVHHYSSLWQKKRLQMPLPREGEPLAEGGWATAEWLAAKRLEMHRAQHPQGPPTGGTAPPADLPADQGALPSTPPDDPPGDVAATYEEMIETGPKAYTDTAPPQGSSMEALPAASGPSGSLAGAATPAPVTSGTAVAEATICAVKAKLQEAESLYNSCHAVATALGAAVDALGGDSAAIVLQARSANMCSPPGLREVVRGVSLRPHDSAGTQGVSPKCVLHQVLPNLAVGTSGASTPRSQQQTPPSTPGHPSLFPVQPPHAHAVHVGELMQPLHSVAEGPGGEHSGVEV